MKRMLLTWVLYAAAPLALLVQSGCMLGPDYQDPVVELAASYRTQLAQVSEAELKWWELFADAQLYTLVTTALENNRDVKIAVSRIEQARSSLNFTGADQFPRLDVELGGRGGNSNGGSRGSATQSTFFAAAPLTWEVDFWGRLSRSTEAARAELLASEFGLKAVQLALISDVVTTYYQLADFHERLRISRATLASREGSLDILQKRFEQGVIALIDINQAQIQKEIAAASIPQFERLIAKTEHTLSLLIGGLPQGFALSEQVPSSPEIPVALPAQLLERRPDLAQLRALIHAQTAAIGAAEALRLPQLALTGLGGIASTDLGAINSGGGTWSLAGQALGPLLDFGKNKARVELQRARVDEALQTYERGVLTALREVEDALTDIVSYREELRVSERQAEAAASANRLSKERYDKGVSSYLEVLDTERSLFSAELRLAELRQLYQSAHVALYKALGGGWMSEADEA